MSPELLAAAQTELASRSLHEFVKQAWHLIEPGQPFIDGWHIRGLAEHLQAVVTGQVPNLLVNVPPGCMKSLLCSVFWPCWAWIKNPALRFYYASYGIELSVRDSIKCRNIISSAWYQERWGDRVQIVHGLDQKTKFETAAGGWRMASSVGGRGTGEHPDIIVVDDPLKADEAWSQTERQNVINWWRGTVASRGVVRGVKRVVIMQRLHQEDLSGYLIEQGGFEHICLPLHYEPERMKPTCLGWQDPRKEVGELLWPGYSPEKVADMRRDMTSLVAAGQLQQRPEDLEGGMFRRDRAELVDVPEQAKDAVRYWDKAATPKGGDYSAGVLIVRYGDYFHVADVVRGRWSAAERNRIMKETAELDAIRFGKHMPIWVEQEPGSGGKESAEITIQDLAGYNIRAHKVGSADGEVFVRAQPFAAQWEAGKVRVAKRNWATDYFDELAVFPNGNNDDQVSASAGAFNKLAQPRKRLLVG